MEEFLQKLGIDKEGTTDSEGKYTVNFPKYEDWAKSFARLNKSSLVEESDESSVLGEENSSIQFDNDEFLITLIADFNAGHYRLSIQRK